MAARKQSRATSVKRAKPTKKTSVRSARKAPAIGKAQGGLGLPIVLPTGGPIGTT
jgi:hypothetical protein